MYFLPRQALNAGISEALCCVPLWLVLGLDLKFLREGSSEETLRKPGGCWWQKWSEGQSGLTLSFNQALIWVEDES